MARQLVQPTQFCIRLFRLPSLSGLGVFALALPLACVAQAGELDFSYGVGLTETISDNIDLGQYRDQGE